MKTRREFVKSMGLACAGLAALRGSAGTVAGTKKIPVGIQLYSFRKQGEKDFAGIIQKAGELGFSGVEFAGYGPYGDKPAELKKLLDDAGLKAFGTHTGYNLIQPDQIRKTMDFHKAIGCPYIIVPWVDPKQMAVKDTCLKIAEVLTRASETAQAEGLYVGYHAHGGDFHKIDGDRTAWEVLFDHTPKAFIHQIDLGNCLGGGGDPYAMIARYPGRSLSVHLKEHGGPKGAVFGQGTVDFKRALALCEQVGGTACYVIEHESDPEQAFEAAKKCLDYVASL
jgi:sugar phosphate isomerase/epimerase